MNPGTRITVSITLLTLFSGSCARAQNSSEQEEFNQLLNLLDERLKHPAPADSYPGDYPYSDGAMFWAQIIYQP
ncbi:MAG: hypothetical protein ACO3DT_14395 [Gammaproteobacteria bacterium]